MRLQRAIALLMCAAPATSLMAAALDRSGQPINAFLQPGNYAEIGYTYITPHVQGKDSSGNIVPEMAEEYSFPQASIKIQATPALSLGLLFDEPFGAAARYQALPGATPNNFVAMGQSYVISPTTSVPYSTLGINGPTEVGVRSKNLTGLVGINVATMMPEYGMLNGVTVYGGPAYQTVRGSLNLRGPAYSLLSGYSAELMEDEALGYVLGAAYEIPKIALRASLTYRSKIEHEIGTIENLPLPILAGGLTAQINGGLATINNRLAAQGITSIDQARAVVAQLSAIPNPNATQAATLNALRTAVDTQAALTAQRATLAPAAALPTTVRSRAKVETPQSVNLDFQTGIMADTLLFANLRWVDWQSFAIRPTLFGQATGLLVPGGVDIINYDKDQWSGTIGVGRKLNPNVSVSLAAGYDTGAGNPITPLGPTEGFKSLGLGVRITPTYTPNAELSLGYRYLWLGDAQARLSSGAIAGNFEDNTAQAFGIRMAYRY